MILISANNEDEVRAIASNMDLINDLRHCDLGEVNTLTLIQMSPAESGWIKGKPVVFDERNGLAIYRLNPDALSWMLSNVDELADEGVDRDDLQEFAKTSTSNLYAVDTF